jgi:4-hydroxy-tetrahydrodipicolinate synthase
MTKTERQRIIEFVRGNFSGTIVNNVSATCISDVRELIAGAQGFADFLLLLPPYYYYACQDAGLDQFFIEALSGTSLPVLLYNFPQHTGNHLSVNLLAGVLDQGVAIRGIKDSSGDIANALLYKSNFPDLAIFLGNDAKAVEVLQKGLAGSVTGTANPIPELLIAIQKEFQLFGNKAPSFQGCLDVWNQFRTASGYPEIPLVKAAMGARLDGFPAHVRASFISIPPEDIDQVRRVISSCLSNYKQINALTAVRSFLKLKRDF